VGVAVAVAAMAAVVVGEGVAVGEGWTGSRAAGRVTVASVAITGKPVVGDGPATAVGSAFDAQATHPKPIERITKPKQKRGIFIFWLPSKGSLRKTSSGETPESTVFYLELDQDLHRRTIAPRLAAIRQAVEVDHRKEGENYSGNARNRCGR